MTPSSKYSVHGSYTQCFTVEVEANSEEEALELARDIDGDLWVEADGGVDIFYYRAYKQGN